LVIILTNRCKKDEESTGIKDGDGNVYTFTTIGTQIWLVENLKTTKYNDGTPIPNITDNATWGNLNTPGYCWYNNDASTYKDTYGALYNWYAINSGKLCPVGWHVPSDSEWTTLTDYLDGESVAGGKLKEISTTHWITPNTGATNENGFTALPGGYRVIDGTFVSIGGFGGWWSATEHGATYVWIRNMTCNSSSVYRIDDEKEYGFSVRWVKD
jgi:uncharacterized protein (TIGR02145 family)